MNKAATLQERKKDAREKISLGGLIVKAGLRYEKRALLLGALIDLKRRIKDDEAERERLLNLGAAAFDDDRT
jgi:hypothetical protein